MQTGDLDVKAPGGISLLNISYRQCYDAHPELFSFVGGLFYCLIKLNQMEAKWILKIKILQIHRDGQWKN